MRPFRRPSAWLPVVCGLALAALAAHAGLACLALAALPIAMLVAGGGRSLLAPDRSAAAHTALGAAITLLASLPLAATGGPTLGVGAFAVGGLCFVASGWLSIEQEPAIEDVPSPPPDVAYAARVALDDVFMSVLNSVTSPPTDDALRAAVAEAAAAYALYEDRGWLESPTRFHSDPPEIERAEATRIRVAGLDCDHLRVESGHEPEPELPGRERWLAHRENRTAHYWVLRHPTPRPWLVCVHGFGMGTPDRDFGAFRARELYEARGLNLAFLALPVHGPRSPTRFSGLEYMKLSPMDFVHAESQAIWDLRRLVRWVRKHDDEPVAVVGISLGGYTTALLAGIEDGLDGAIAGVPPSDLISTDERLSNELAKDRYREAGFTPERNRALHRVVSPLAMEPRLAYERRFIFAATGDHFVPVEQVRRLWRHWDRPRIAWTRGGHVSALLQHEPRALVDEAIGACLEPRESTAAA